MVISSKTNKVKGVESSQGTGISRCNNVKNDINNQVSSGGVYTGVNLPRCACQGALCVSGSRAINVITVLHRLHVLLPDYVIKFAASQAPRGLRPTTNDHLEAVGTIPSSDKQRLFLIIPLNSINFIILFNIIFELEFYIRIFSVFSVNLAQFGQFPVNFYHLN